MASGNLGITSRNLDQEQAMCTAWCVSGTSQKCRG